MKGLRIRTLFISAAAISIIAVLIIVLTAVFDFFHVGGSEFSWAELADNEAIVTVEIRDDSGVNPSETHNLTRGQGIALQSLLLRTHYLRDLSGSLRLRNDSSTYDILIRFPSRNVSFHLFEGIRGYYLSHPGYSGWLKILDKDWETAFHGILDAG